MKTTNQTDCIFCNIISGTIPSYKVYEDETTYAFLDAHPTNPGHTLIIPKEHSRTALDMSSEHFASLMKVAHHIAGVVKVAVKTDGINIVCNIEPAAGQVVFHTHVHIVPRLLDDGFRWWPGGEYGEGEAETMAKKIRDEL